MKFTLFAFLFAAFFAAVAMADLADEIAAAKKKFCGGISVTAPTKNKVFTNPKKVTLTVTRVPNAMAKTISGVDLYSISSSGKPTYLGAVSTKSYTLNKKASLTVDLTKYKKLKLPGQFEFRVWVHNADGPDCTLMSKVFKVKSSSHSNAAEDEEIANMSTDIDRGCFGVEIVKPALGEHVQANKFIAQIARDGASQVETVTGLELFKVNLEDRQPVKVQDSWTGESALDQAFNIKDKVAESDSSDAYFYKVTGSTQDNESCTFFSHPFYIDA
ncbi:hypothetical protein BX666DRAFT_1848675 [Dichotomocladium elegans]|nr:hypothetical protein BX666DRAFT_1848675 [Dichotomocladium elegans]